MFVDETTIEVIAGKGGDGCASFRREPFVPRGGPDGGDGGRGGDVIMRANRNVASLLQLANQKTWKAKNGEQGGSSQCHGASGDDLVIEVPVGTMVFDAKHDLLLKDLKEDKEEFVVAQAVEGIVASEGEFILGEEAEGPVEEPAGEPAEEIVEEAAEELSVIAGQKGVDVC